jgi:hypothetical protein
MATITPTLTITSTDAITDTLSLSATTNNLIINFAGTAGLSLGPEEFAFFPAQASTEVTGISSSSHTVLVEFAYFTEQ